MILLQPNQLYSLFGALVCACIAPAVAVTALVTEFYMFLLCLVILGVHSVVAREQGWQEYAAGQQDVFNAVDIYTHDSFRSTTPAVAAAQSDTDSHLDDLLKSFTVGDLWPEDLSTKE
jgi:hypothetical protein